jgi:hypothetical protein
VSVREWPGREEAEGTERTEQVDGVVEAGDGEQKADSADTQQDGAEPELAEENDFPEESAEEIGDSVPADEQPQEEPTVAPTIDQTQAIRMRRLRLAAA